MSGFIYCVYVRRNVREYFWDTFRVTRFKLFVVDKKPKQNKNVSDCCIANVILTEATFFVVSRSQFFVLHFHFLTNSRIRHTIFRNFRKLKCVPFGFNGIITFVPSVVKICQVAEKLKVGTHTHTRSENGDLFPKE